MQPASAGDGHAGALCCAERRRRHHQFLPRRHRRPLHSRPCRRRPSRLRHCRPLGCFHPDPPPPLPPSTGPATLASRAA